MKINVMLYGDGSRQTPLRVEEVHCSRCEECSLYKEGKCLQITKPFGYGCKYGVTYVTDKATKMAKKYNIIRTKAKEDGMYGKLEYPSNLYFFSVGDDYCFLLSYCQLVKNDFGKYVIDSCGLFSRASWIKKEDLTMDILHGIMTASPRNLSGQRIDSYKTKIIPNLLFQMKYTEPTLYEAYIGEHPEMADVEPNFIGRYAYMNTLNKDMNIIYKDKTGNFHFDETGKNLIGTFCSCFLPFKAKEAQVIIPVTEDMTFEITDNKQVIIGKTVFK